MNRKLLLMIILVPVVLIVTLLIQYFSIKNIVCVYEAGNKTIYRPDCGYYIQVSSDRPDKIERYGDETKLFLLTLDLYEYRQQTIPEHKLAELEGFLEEAARCGAKCIFRAAYGFDREESNDADSLERIEEHVSQIAPVLNEYKEQIVCVQAGLFGPWGEWHSSRYLEGESARKNRYLLTDIWLKNLDSEIVIALRRPSFIREAVEDGAPIERIGLHNDGLLASETDLGTYKDAAGREEDLQWLRENLVTGKNGGEMPYVNEYSRAERAVAEFAKMKISYLNMKYNEAVLEDWKTQQIDGENAYEYISKRLGPRIYISRVCYPEKIKGGIFALARNISVTLTNEGFSPLSSDYGLEWVIADTEGKIHGIAASADLYKLGNAESLEVLLPVGDVCDIDIKKIGIRIFRTCSGTGGEREYLETANDTPEYSDGVTYFYVKSENSAD